MTAMAAGLALIPLALGAGKTGNEIQTPMAIVIDVAPLRDVFGLLFFVSVGMLFDPRYVMAHAGKVALIVTVIVAGKSLICGLLARAFGYGNMAPWIVGLGLSQIGEFSFVLARAGYTGRFIAKDTYDLALTCTVLSMALSPLAFSGALPVARVWARWRRPAQPSTVMQVPGMAVENHVVVAGYGRTGRAVVDAL
jgi:CPA2 family monovalent cation:H+ antiporter-2